MPDHVCKALFVVTGLMLLRRLWSLCRGLHTRAGRWAAQGVGGVCMLLVANTVGGAFGLGLGLNALTLPISAALGPAGVALLWALRYLL